MLMWDVIASPLTKEKNPSEALLQDRDSTIVLEIPYSWNGNEHLYNVYLTLQQPQLFYCHFGTTRLYLHLYCSWYFDCRELVHSYYSWKPLFIPQYIIPIWVPHCTTTQLSDCTVTEELDISKLDVSLCYFIFL